MYTVIWSCEKRSVTYADRSSSRLALSSLRCYSCHQTFSWTSYLKTCSHFDHIHLYKHKMFAWRWTLDKLAKKGRHDPNARQSMTNMSAVQPPVGVAGPNGIVLMGAWMRLKANVSWNFERNVEQVGTRSREDLKIISIRYVLLIPLITRTGYKNKETSSRLYLCYLSSPPPQWRPLIFTSSDGNIYMMTLE